MKFEPVFFDIETTGFNPGTPSWYSGKQAAEVTAIGLGHVRDWDKEGEDDELKVILNRGNQEYELIETASDWFERKEREVEDRGNIPVLTGFNIRQFDCMYWGGRCGRLRLDPYPIGYGWYRLDMMRALTIPDSYPISEMEGSNRNYPKQDDYARYLGIDFRDDLTGEQMPKAFADGRYEEIGIHVKEDTRVMMEIFVEENQDMVDQLWDHYGDKLDFDKPNLTDTVTIDIENSHDDN